MRQTQSNRRGRGRSRKAQSPLTKNYESNGPEIKIRGTAAHISEKYTSLARDAAATSDTVRHENYLQHAEHYNRIIAAAQQNNQAQAQANAQANGQAATGEDDAEGGNQPVANVADEQQAESNNNNQNKKRNQNNRRRRPEGQRNNQSGRDGRQAKNSDDQAKKEPSEEAAKEKVEAAAVQKIEPIVKEVKVAPVEASADDAAA